MTWAERGREFIAKLDIPADATLKDTRKIFRAEGWRFHGGTSWGRKAWGKVTREFQRKRGLLPPLAIEPTPSHLFPADITFPFREQA